MPDWATDLRARLATLRLSPAREAEIVEELAQHLDERYEALLARGTSAADARRLALEELDGPDVLAQYMGGLRQAHVPPPVAPGAPASSRFRLADLWQDLRYAVRMLRKQPGFAAAAILTLGLGIGANTAIFSLVNATLLQRLPVADRDRLVYVKRQSNGGVFPYPLYAALRDRTQTFAGLAAWGGISVSLNANDATDLVLGFIVTGNFFEVLGVKAAQGRLISPADDVKPGGHPVAVISHDFWQTRFEGRPDIVGRDIRLNGHLFTIVGVTPAGFPGPVVGHARGVYVPIMMQPIVRPPGGGYTSEQNASMLLRSEASWLFGVGRLATGAIPDQARAELATLATTELRRTNPSRNAEGMTLVPIDQGDPNERQQMRSVAWLLGGVVGMVLLIACANVANLLLARAASRRRELAVRLAIGASRARLVRQLLTESVLLSIIGGVVGVGLAWAAMESFQAAPPPAGALPFRIDFAIDRRVLAFSIGLSLLTGIVFGIAPALKASRPALVPALKDASTEGDNRPRRLNLQKTLVVAEVALSVLLLIPAGLFVRSLLAARAIETGVDVEKLVAAPVSLNTLRYTSVKGRELYRDIVERVERMPGVEAASLARVAVMSGAGRVLGLMVEGRPGYVDDFVFSSGNGVVTTDFSRINANIVSPGFFRTLGVPLRSGRDFGAQDVEDRPPVVIINETAAKLHFSGTNPVGQRVSFNGTRGPWREIVGVVGDSKYATLGEGPLAVAYLPASQNYDAGMTLYVRTSVPPASLVGALRHEIRAIEPNLPLPNIRTMTDAIGTSLYTARMGAWLLAAFGGLALLLAAIGVYGVLSFSIARRTRELGIRLALGAEMRNVFLLVVRDGMLLVGAGLVIGLIGGLAGGRSLASFLYGVPTSDLTTFAATTIMLLAVALVACVIPARRAMRVDPLRALRYD